VYLNFPLLDKTKILDPSHKKFLCTLLSGGMDNLVHVRRDFCRHFNSQLVERFHARSKIIKELFITFSKIIKMTYKISRMWVDHRWTGVPDIVFFIYLFFFLNIYLLHTRYAKTIVIYTSICTTPVRYRPVTAERWTAVSSRKKKNAHVRA
jgi:hypothetical protein